MRRLKVGAAALNQTPLGWRGNATRIREAINQARRAKLDVLCLPEMCIPGYGCEDAYLAQDTWERSRDLLLELSAETHGLTVTLGLPVRLDGQTYNVIALAHDGAVLGCVAKQHLAGDGLHYEPRWFSAWPTGVVKRFTLGDQEVPIGDIVLRAGDIKYGIEICEDAWVKERPVRSLAARGAQVILNPSASHFAFGKHRERRALVEAASTEYGVIYVYANMLGNASGRVIYDGDVMVSSPGQPTVCGPRLSFREIVLTSSELTLPDDRPEPAARTTADTSNSDMPKEEAFTRAVALGLMDYLRRSRARGFVVSLSGGADSAACVCLIRAMVELSRRELGTAGFTAHLGHISTLRECNTTDEVMQQLLTTAYQRTSNSGPVTRDAARRLAEAIGATHHELDVDPIVKGYISLIEGALDRPLTWKEDDLALQNIQARARAPGIWMLANIKGALLVSTSNRSEAAVGYATMDGDTAGGLSPVAGIDKAFLLRWLRWFETEGPEGMGAIGALNAVNVQVPTAELRPQGAHQTDEADLMPYPVLDAIERAAIRDRLSPLEVFKVVTRSMPERPVLQLGAWVERFFTLWCRNQWKRERYAPSFHLDDENLDPKTWCRFPILSGGYEVELEELRAHLKAKHL